MMMMMNLEDTIEHLSEEFLITSFETFTPKEKHIVESSYIYSMLLPKEYASLSAGGNHIIASSENKVYGIFWEEDEDGLNIKYWIEKPSALIKYIEKSLATDEETPVEDARYVLRELLDLDIEGRCVTLCEYIQNEFLKLAYILDKAIHKYDFLLSGKVARGSKVDSTIKKIKHYNSITSEQLNTYGNISQYLGKQVISVEPLFHKKNANNFLAITLKDCEDTVLWRPENFGSALPRFCLKQGDKIMELQAKGKLLIENYSVGK